MILPRVYPVMPDADWVARMAAGGAQLIQLRFKGAAAEIPAQIDAARRACAAQGAQLVVNDHWRAAISAGCDFIHLGQEDLDAADLGAIREAGLRLGVSTHDEAELTRALALEPAYIALGPIWPTMLKKMKWAPQGLARLGAWKRRIGAIPLVAIGGVTLERLPQALMSGADSVAMVTDLVTAPQPEARLGDWLAAAERAVRS